MKELIKLRIQLLGINIVLISLAMFFVFTTIYIVTYKQTRDSINIELDNLSMPWDNPGGTYIKDLEDTMRQAENDSDKKEPEIDSTLPDKSITFTIFTYPNNTIHKIYTFFNTETSFYPRALNLALEESKDRGIVKIDGYIWAYGMQKFDKWNSYTFLDVSAKQNMLDRLVVTFLSSTILSLILIFFISLYLTNKALQPVRYAFDKQKMFISNVSHEIKTPITIIQADIDFLLNNNPSAKDRKWLNLIHTEARNMTKLTNYLLNLARVEAEEAMSTVSENLNLSKELESVLLSAEGLVYEKGRSLVYSIDPDIGYRGIRQNIDSIFKALIENAIKYSESGGSIRVKLMRNKKNIFFEIANDGKGIPQEDLPHIFDRFYRVDKARNREDGSFGLGLAITKALVEQEHGLIKCISTVGGETVFTITLRSYNFAIK